MPRHTLPVLFAILASACAPFAASPALRTVPIETAEPVRFEHTAIQASVGAHTEQVITTAARLRHGIHPDVELQMEGSWAYLPHLEAERDLVGHVGVGRIGVKHRVLRWLAFTGGVGAGAGPWGSYAGADLGTIFAYENPWVVPFCTLRMQLTGPLDASSERIESTNGMGMTTITMLTPTPTIWLQHAIGFRIPICAECEGVRGSFAGAISWTELYALDQDRTMGAFGSELGFEIEL